jgi:hypothetical protein
MFKLLLRIYLIGAIIIPTVAIAASFVWYIQEYDMAYALHKTDKETAYIHRNNSLWLGLWGGVYGIISTTAAGFLLYDLRSSNHYSSITEKSD